MILEQRQKPTSGRAMDASTDEEQQQQQQQQEEKELRVSPTGPQTLQYLSQKKHPNSIMQHPSGYQQRVLATTELERNWASTGLSSRESDRQFKFHVARMAQIYHGSGHGSTVVDNETPRTMKAPPPIVAERAAVRAYLASPSKQKKKSKNTGQRALLQSSVTVQRDWSDSFAHENALLPQKERAMIAHWKGLNAPVPSKIQSPFDTNTSAAAGPTGCRPSSATNVRRERNQTRSVAASDRNESTSSRRPRPRSAPRTSGKFSLGGFSTRGAQRVRVGGGGAKAAKHLGGHGGGPEKYHSTTVKLTEAEARLLEGRYQMTPEQSEVYNAFTELLADFDVFEMVQILEDALKDAQKQTLLDDYYGAVDS